MCGRSGAESHSGRAERLSSASQKEDRASTKERLDQTAEDDHMSGHKKSNRTIPGESRMRKPLSRRQILRGSAAAAGSLATASIIGSPFPVRAAGEDLTVFTWETYHDDPWIVEFTKNTGIKVNVVRTG